MSGFGATVQAITRAIEVATDATNRALRSAIGGRRPKLIPLAIPVESRRPRR